MTCVMEARETKLGFKPQKELVYTKFLPYADALDGDSNKQLADIKTYLGRAVLLKDLRPGCIYWVHRLNVYISLFGRKFSKEDHICFIKLLYELVTIPNLEITLVQFFIQALTNLLKKKELIPPQDLQLPWRPLYELYESIAYSPYETLGLVLFPGPEPEFSKAITSLLQELGMPKQWSSKMARLEGKRYITNSLKTLIRICQVYFPLSATQEMLDEWRPLLCPFDISINKGFTYFDLFLPTLLPPEHHNKGFKLWFEEFMGMWQIAHNSPSWETNLIWLFSRLAVDNIGYIDWQPYIPMIFTKLLRCFNLPVGSQMQVGKSVNGFEIIAACNFITSMLGGGSKCQQYLTRLFTSLESYYHPSNNGKWNLKLNRLLYKLPVSFVKRLHRERFKKHTWEPVIPESHHLTNAEVTEFVNSIKPCILLAMFSKSGSLHSATAVQNLSVLRPELIIPPLLERLYPALETLTEPHRLIASMQCVISASRSILQSSRFYPESRSHVIPLLMFALPGIDPNDFKKCMVTFQFIFAFVTLIPIVDCSGALQVRTDLTEQEQELCLATRGFEDFVLQFMDKCFALIENSTLELVTKLDRETEKMNSQEGMLELMLTATFFAILTQCSEEIYKSALSKLKSFITGRVLETKVSGKFAANMCRGAARANPEVALKTLLPYICKMILTLTSSEDIMKEEVLDNELLFNMLLLSEIVCCSGQYLLQYQVQINEVLLRTLHLTSKPGYMLAGSLLRHCLKSLTHLSVLESRSIPESFDRPFDEYMPVRDWGEPGDLDNLNIQWHIPSAEEKAWASKILHQVLVPELELLDKVSSKEKILTREEIQQSLSIILDVIIGAGALFPISDENSIELVNCKVPLTFPYHTYGSDSEGLTILNGKNIRMEIGKTVSKLLDFIINTSEDDTKSLFQIIQIYHNLMFFLGVKKDDFEARWKSFQFAKKAMENKFLGKKQHSRSLLIDRILMQHEMFILERVQTRYTPMHQKIMEDLLKLSTSHYSEVRTRAQSVLSNSFRVYSYSYRLFIPQLLNLLRNDPAISHEEFKGALYVILGNKSRNILTQPDWKTLYEVWPAVIQAQHSEKPSIIRLIEEIREQIQKNLETIALYIEIPDKCLNQAKKLWEIRNPNCHLPIPEPSELVKADDGLKLTVQDNLRFYHKLVESLVDLINSGNLRWRHHHLALCLLTLMLRCDIPLPAPAVKIFVQNLINEALNVRKISIGAIAAILKQQKREHKKKQIDPFSVKPNAEIGSVNHQSSLDHIRLLPGNRNDNEWLQFNSEFLPVTEDAWEKRVFVNKTHFGFYCWPLNMEVYAPASEQPSLERTHSQLPLEETVLYDFFNEPKNIEQWVNFLSLEDRKGKDKFDAKRFVLFKGLFRNFGTTFLPHFIPHLQRLVAENHESCQRCASEIIAGIIRGSKHWPFKMVQQLQTTIEPILRTALSKVTVETVADWGTCIATASENGDPNRLHWLLNLIMEDPMRAEEGSFAEASRLYVLQGGIAQQEWRVAELLHRLLDYLKPYLTHPYQNVRIRLGSVLTNIFLMDIDLPGGLKTTCPRRKDFVEGLLPQLSILEAELNSTKSSTAQSIELNTEIENAPGDGLMNKEKSGNHLTDTFLENTDRKIEVSLLKTICKWFLGNLTRASYTAPPEFFRLLPLLCLLESNDSDEELKQDCVVALLCFGQAYLTPSNIQIAINTLCKIRVCKSWRARASSLGYLQVMVFNNLFTVLQNQGWVKEISNIVLGLLEDERVEVREMAGVTLGGLFHCEFIPFTDELMRNFRSKSCQKLRRNRSEPVSVEAVVQRHAGILGLCAYVTAHPYDVPENIPDILMILGDHLNDPQPIPLTIKKTLSNFRRTHYDSWRDHKLKFSDDQLAVLTDLLVSPSYYA